MAVHHRCWRFSVPAVVEGVRGISRLDDLFTSEVTALAERVRADPGRTEHLVLARLDPTDDEVWTEILLGRTAAESAREPPAAKRLMLVLIDHCVPVGGVAAPFLVEEALKAAGWDQARRELVLRGRRLFTFFQTHAEWLGAVAGGCRYWLDGGWLDALTAAELGDRLAERPLPLRPRQRTSLRSGARR